MGGGNVLAVLLHLIERTDDFARTISLEMGKPLAEAAGEGRHVITTSTEAAASSAVRMIRAGAADPRSTGTTAGPSSRGARL